MPDRQLYVIAYDIREPRRLRRALYIMKDYAWGGQKSVFECFLTSAEKRELCERIRRTINEDEDSLLAFRVPEHKTIQGLGIACLPRDEPLFYVG